MKGIPVKFDTPIPTTDVSQSSRRTQKRYFNPDVLGGFPQVLNVPQGTIWHDIRMLCFYTAGSTFGDRWLNIQIRDEQQRLIYTANSAIAERGDLMVITVGPDLSFFVGETTSSGVLTCVMGILPVLYGGYQITLTASMGGDDALFNIALMEDAV